MTALDPWGWADRRRNHRIRVWAIVALVLLLGAGTCGFVVHKRGWDCVESQLRGYLWHTTACTTAGEP
jgi:hypothetical protein